MTTTPTVFSNHSFPIVVSVAADQPLLSVRLEYCGTNAWIVYHEDEPIGWINRHRLHGESRWVAWMGDSTLINTTSRNDAVRELLHRR